MESVELGDFVFVRLDPGERIIQSLGQVARELDIRVGAIASGVGMLAEVELGFFCVSKNDYDRTTMTGIYDLSSIQGNITWMGDEPVPHVHMTFNDPNFATYSGHIIEASCHITMEIFIKRIGPARLRRVKVEGTPATRIAAKSKGKSGER